MYYDRICHAHSLFSSLHKFLPYCSLLFLFDFHLFLLNYSVLILMFCAFPYFLQIIKSLSIVDILGNTKQYTEEESCLSVKV